MQQKFECGGQRKGETVWLEGGRTEEKVAGRLEDVDRSDVVVDVVVVGLKEESEGESAERSSFAREIVVDCHHRG